MDLHVQAYKQIHQHLLHCHRKYYQGFISICVTVAFIARGFFPANARVHRFSTAKITLHINYYVLLCLLALTGFFTVALALYTLETEYGRGLFKELQTAG